jgi:HD superfamily phosphodiesterase
MYFWFKSALIIEKVFIFARKNKLCYTFIEGVILFTKYSLMSLVEQSSIYTSELLKKCESYPYHNPTHTLWVFDRATYLALAERVDGEDLEDLQIACYFHDTGFTEHYEKNEHIWAHIARKWLTEKWHPEDRIEKIEGIIMATVLFSKPKTHLERIIQDADLDNIGTKSEFFYSQRMLEELRTIGWVEISDCSYWQFVYTLLTKYKFHTETAKKERYDQQVRDVEHMEKYLSMIGCEVPKIEKNSMHQV